MSSKLARTEMARFLRNPEPEVLSVSGRWGVGKTFGWFSALEEARKANVIPFERYAYVSAFGVRSLDDLKTAVFQATVRLNRSDIRPTLLSFQENLGSLEGLGALAETGGRRAAKAIKSLITALPWVGGTADLLLPAAGLLIRNQIVCIDDVERSGDSLKLADILGFVSGLREEKGCKVVLLLNEEGLGDDQEDYRKYLEKVVDQAIQYTPTPSESASVALSSDTEIDRRLADRIITLGITNIRVVKRVRRFIRHLEPTVSSLNSAVMRQAVDTIALLGWCLFEPTLAPKLDFVISRSSFSLILQQENQLTAEEAAWNALLDKYGFSHADDFDLVLLEGLRAGGFDHDRVRKEAQAIDALYAQAEVRAGIQAPWSLYGESFDDNEGEIVASLIQSVHEFGHAMSPGDLDSVITTLKQLLGDASPSDLVDVYMAQQEGRPREFFDLAHHHALRRDVAPEIRVAFDARLAATPLERDPTEILASIGARGSWNPEDVEFLASLSADAFYAMFKEARGEVLRNIVRGGLTFGQMHGANEADRTVGEKTQEALRRIGQESTLNQMRVAPYLTQANA